MSWIDQTSPWPSCMPAVGFSKKVGIPVKRDLSERKKGTGKKRDLEREPGINKADPEQKGLQIPRYSGQALPANLQPSVDL